jgi:hypothetical protein
LSHIAKIELEINDLTALREACQRLGFEFMENQHTFAWYGVWVGRYPLPEGLTEEDLGRCNHAIRIPGAEYEVGVIKRDHSYILFWDSWRKGGLEKETALGQGAKRLKQAYALERVKHEARLKGYKLHEKKIDQGIRLVLTA